MQRSALWFSALLSIGRVGINPYCKDQNKTSIVDFSIYLKDVHLVHNQIRDKQIGSEFYQDMALFFFAISSVVKYFLFLFYPWSFAGIVLKFWISLLKRKNDLLRLSQGLQCRRVFLYIGYLSDVLRKKWALFIISVYTYI